MTDTRWPAGHGSQDQGSTWYSAPPAAQPPPAQPPAAYPYPAGPGGYPDSQGYQNGSGYPDNTGYQNGTGYPDSTGLPERHWLPGEQ